VFILANLVMTTNLAPLILVIKLLDVFILWTLKLALTTQFVILMIVVTLGLQLIILRENARKLYAILKEESVLKEQLALNATFQNAKRTVNQRILVKPQNVLYLKEEQSVLELQSFVMTKKLVLLINVILNLDVSLSTLLTKFVNNIANVPTMKTAKITKPETN